MTPARQIEPWQRPPVARQRFRTPSTDRAGTAQLTAAVISAVMLSINWNGAEDSTAAPKIDDLLNIMIVLSSKLEYGPVATCARRSHEHPSAHITFLCRRVGRLQRLGGPA